METTAADEDVNVERIRNNYPDLNVMVKSGTKIRVNDEASVQMETTPVVAKTPKKDDASVPDMIPMNVLERRSAGGDRILCYYTKRDSLPHPKLPTYPNINPNTTQKEQKPILQRIPSKIPATLASKTDLTVIQQPPKVHSISAKMKSNTPIQLNLSKKPPNAKTVKPKETTVLESSASEIPKKCINIITDSNSSFNKTFTKTQIDKLPPPQTAFRAFATSVICTSTSPMEPTASSNPRLSLGDKSKSPFPCKTMTVASSYKRSLTVVDTSTSDISRSTSLLPAGAQITLVPKPNAAPSPKSNPLSPKSNAPSPKTNEVPADASFGLSTDDAKLNAALVKQTADTDSYAPKTSVTKITLPNTSPFELVTRNDESVVSTSVTSYAAHTLPLTAVKCISKVATGTMSSPIAPQPKQSPDMLVPACISNKSALTVTLTSGSGGDDTVQIPIAVQARGADSNVFSVVSVVAVQGTPDQSIINKQAEGVKHVVKQVSNQPIVHSKAVVVNDLMPAPNFSKYIDKQNADMSSSNEVTNEEEFTSAGDRSVSSLMSPLITIHEHMGPVLRRGDEPECFTISSDEEQEQHLILSNSDAWESIMKKEPPPFETEKDLKNYDEKEFENKIDSSVTTGIVCRTVRIGSYKAVPRGEISVSKYGFKFTVPSVHNPSESVTIRIPAPEIRKLLTNFTRQLPVIFLYVTSRMAKKVRTMLKINSKSDYYFDPFGEDETHRRITFLPERITEGYIRNMMNNFEPYNFFETLGNEEANSILIRSAPRDVLKTKPVPPPPSNPVQTIMVFPPPPAKGGISINTEDYSCLSEDVYLNDVIIDFYLKYLYDVRLSPEDRRRTHVFSSFFYKRLTDKSTPIGKGGKTLSPAEIRHSRVKNWTKNIDIFSKDFIVIPLNENLHWFLAIICFPNLRGPVRFSDNTPVVETVPTKADTSAEENTAAEEEKTSDSVDTLNASGSVTITRVKSEPPLQIHVEDEEEGHEERDEADGADEDCGNFQSDEDSVENDVNPESEITGSTSLKTTKKEPIKQPCILVFDSLAGASRARIIATLREYLQVEYMTKHNTWRDFSKKVIKGSCPKVPQQTNYTDCGLYVLQYVESFFESKITDFRIPIRLPNWFNEETVSRKRFDIQQLLLELMRKQNIDIDNLNLPQLHFGSDVDQDEDDDGSLGGDYEDYPESMYFDDDDTDEEDLKSFMVDEDEGNMNEDDDDGVYYDDEENDFDEHNIIESRSYENESGSIADSEYESDDAGMLEESPPSILRTKRFVHRRQISASIHGSIPSTVASAAPTVTLDEGCAESDDSATTTTVVLGLEDESTSDAALERTSEEEPTIRLGDDNHSVTLTKVSVSPAPGKSADMEESKARLDMLKKARPFDVKLPKNSSDECSTPKKFRAS